MTHPVRPPSVKRLFRFVARSADDIRSDVDEEFAFHLDMRIEDLVNSGLSEGDAREPVRESEGRSPSDKTRTPA